MGGLTVQYENRTTSTLSNGKNWWMSKPAFGYTYRDVSGDDRSTYVVSTVYQWVQYKVPNSTLQPYRWEVQYELNAPNISNRSSATSSIGWTTGKQARYGGKTRLCTDIALRPDSCSGNSSVLGF